MKEASSDLDLSPQAIALVEDAIRSFAKALRATKMYLPNSPTRAAAIEQARGAFSKVWRHVNPLEIDVRESSFVWELRVVYHDAERGTEGLPWLLFRDGLRQMSFVSGFEVADLDPLLDVLQQARAATPDDDDLVTLLWLADLSAFEYRHVESSGVSDLPTLGGERGGDRTGVATFGAGIEPLAVPAAETAPPGDGPATHAEPSGDFDAALYFLDARELHYLQEEIKREYADDPRKLALTMLFEIIDATVSVDARVDAIERVDQLLLEFLSLGEYELVAYALREGAASARKGDAPPQVVRQLDALPARLSEPAVMTQLLQALDDSARAPVASLLEGVFAELRPSALVPLLAWVGSAGSSPARAAIERASLRLASAHLAELWQLLEHRDPTVVRGALRLVTQLATPSAVPALIRLFRSPDPLLRQDVITALGAVDSLGALQAIERGVDDADRDVRIVALRMVGARKYHGALPRLAIAIRRKELRDADLGEKVALFEAFGTICGGGGVPELDALLNARGLLGPRESAEMRACAARALGLVNSADADVALQRASDTKDAVVRSAVARALRRGA